MKKICQDKIGRISCQCFLPDPSELSSSSDEQEEIEMNKGNPPSTSTDIQKNSVEQQE